MRSGDVAASDEVRAGRIPDSLTPRPVAASSLSSTPLLTKDVGGTTWGEGRRGQWGKERGRGARQRRSGAQSAGGNGGCGDAVGARERARVEQAAESLYGCILSYTRIQLRRSARKKKEVWCGAAVRDAATNRTKVVEENARADERGRRREEG